MSQSTTNNHPISGKRRFKELNHNEENQIAEKTKKRKVVETDKIHSKLFRDEEDQNQFKEIFKSIEQSELIKQLSIPSCINFEISQYATGNIENCKNLKCENKIITLNEDFQCGCSFPVHGTYPVHDSYLADFDGDFYCKKCKEETEICYGCDSIIFIPDCSICSICSVPILDGGGYHLDCCNERSFAWKCFECQCILCTECKHYCDNCDQTCCPKCFDFDEIEDGNYFVFKCEICHKFIPLPHENCNIDYAVEVYNYHQDYQFDFCSYPDCGGIVCVSCDFSRTGCDSGCCQGITEYFCSKHAPESKSGYF